MIISKTPLRIEFTGGSDLPAFYHQEPGAIVNVTINKYIFVSVRNPNFYTNNPFYIDCGRVDDVKSVHQIKDTLIRLTLRYKKAKELSLSSFSDLPTQTGLGSSGSFLVGLLHVLSNMNGKICTPMELAKDAFYVEGHLAKVNCGPQDQMAAALGGLRLHEFLPDDSLKSKVVKCSPQTFKTLEENLLLFYTGNQRSSHNLLDNLSKTLTESAKARGLMSQRVKLSHQMAKEIHANSLTNFGEMLDEDWRLKKEIAPIETNDVINSIYTKAIRAGASGGKLVGAGGQGFMLFYAPKDRHEKIQKALKTLKSFDVAFTHSGSQIIQS